MQRQHRAAIFAHAQKTFRACLLRRISRTGLQTHQGPMAVLAVVHRLRHHAGRLGAVGSAEHVLPGLQGR